METDRDAVPVSNVSSSYLSQGKDGVGARCVRKVRAVLRRGMSPLPLAPSAVTNQPA